MLSMLGQDALSRVVFPVGDMTKDEVRAHARRLGLRTAGKPDSQDVCFIGSAEGREGFLSPRVELHAAEVVDGEGRPAGSVHAVELVTVGQRRGMGHGSDGKRRYVTHVDVEARRVTVGSAAEVLRSSVLLAGPSLTWVDQPLAAGARAVAQVSAHGRPVPCTVLLQAGQRRGPLRRPAAPRGAGPDGGALRRARPRRRRGRGHRRLTVAGTGHAAAAQRRPAGGGGPGRRAPAQIIHNNELYNVLDAPEIPDAEYDLLVVELRQLEADYPSLATPDSPTHTVGAAPSGLFQEVNHRVPMMSLDNAFSEDDLRAWGDRLRRQPPELDLEALAFSCEPKVDGVAMSLTYEQRHLVQAATVATASPART